MYHFCDAFHPHLWPCSGSLYLLKHLHEEDVFCLASSGLCKWQEKYLGSQKPMKEYGIPENAGREKEETDKGNEVASNINLVFLEAFLWGSDYFLG